jgi:hypothetical protein
MVWLPRRYPIVLNDAKFLVHSAANKHTVVARCAAGVDEGIEAAASFGRQCIDVTGEVAIKWRWSYQGPLVRSDGGGNILARHRVRIVREGRLASQCRRHCSHLPTRRSSDGWMAPLRHLTAKLLSHRFSSELEPSTGELTTIGLDLAQHVFQMHGVDAERESNDAGWHIAPVDDRRIGVT